MLPITSGTLKPRSPQDVRVKDEHLARVLRGQDYLIFDGAMGTMLQRRDLKAGELPELLCLTDPDSITDIHREYVAAGSQAVTTNTFGANARKLDGAATVDEIFQAAISCARASGAQYVAADIGPTGALLEPMGTLPFDEAYNLFAEQAKAAQKYGADLFIIETMTDLLEVKAAVLACKENSDLPIFATMTFDETGRTFLGTSPTVAAIVLSSLGVNALGVNCSLGPDALGPVVDEMLKAARCPVMVQANAGLPDLVDGKTVYSITPDAYVTAVESMVRSGATIIGGCCGTDPDYIAREAKLIAGTTPPARKTAPLCTVTSAQNAVVLHGREVAIIGERINPTGKKKLKEALRSKDYDYVVGEAIAQADAGADLLDVNAGLPEIDEGETLVQLIKKIQSVCGLPLQIDSSDPAAVEGAVRRYAGKPLINSVNGKQENMDAVLPIVKHYGCAVVGLTLDESGIPPTAEERFAIAQKIVAEAAKYGIPKQDVFIDCLVMSASTNQNEVVEILRAVNMVKTKLGCRTVLGVSNVSFGLPARPIVNGTFLAAAFAAGLDMPMLNPLADRYREVVDTWRVLCAQDANAQHYIAEYANRVMPATAPAAAAVPSASAENGQPATDTDDSGTSELYRLVIAGNKGPVPAATEALLAQMGAMDVINKHLIPALDEVGERFEKGTFFLPQLMASAEAAKAGFDVIRAQSATEDAGKGPIAVATVKGDIHDIGKNIVKMLLENYGYRVIDLGRDVDPQTVLDRVREHDVKIVGLSALMTTTVKGMSETIELLHAEAPDVKIMVGGAVLNEEYAQMVGADFYAKDAAESARYAGEVLG